MRTSRRYTLLVAVVAVVGVVGGALASGAGAASNGGPKRGGTVTYARSNQTRTFDPAKMSVGPLAGIEAQALYDQLFYEDATGRPSPGIAKSLDISTDGTVYTVKLRPDVKFSDGSNFDANAVIAHWTRLKDPATASAAIRDMAEIKTMEAVDPLTVKFTLNAPDTTFTLPLMTGAMTYVPSPAAVTKFGTSYGTSPDTIVGAGPFKLQELVFGSYETFVRSTTYWDAPKPYLDGMTFKFFETNDARYNTFISGGADIIENLVATATNIELDKNYTNISPLPFGGGYGMALNTTVAPTDDPGIRKALRLAINMEAVLQRAIPGSIPAPTLYDKSAPWYVPLKVPDNNLKEAQSLVDDYLKRTGQSSVTVDIVHAEVSAGALQALQQDWAKVKNLNVNVTINSIVQNTTLLARRDYKNGIVSAAGGTPRGVLNQYLPNSATNTSFLNDPQMTAAVTKANTTTNQAEVKAAMKTVAERFNALTPYIMFNRLNTAAWTNKKVAGVTGSPSNPVVFKTQDMYRT